MYVCVLCFVLKQPLLLPPSDSRGEKKSGHVRKICNMYNSLHSLLSCLIKRLNCLRFKKKSFQW